MNGNRLERIDASRLPPLPPADAFHLGTAAGPGKPTISVDATSLKRDGVPWLGVMGEVHYSRLDPATWHRELTKMKAGGLDVVASYVFWIHHEEVEGQFDFTGCRDLRRFVQTCAEVGLPVIIRLGPWCHGEVRNGGLPDWLLAKPLKPRTDDPEYLTHVRRLYTKIAEQLKGLLWKGGGPVLGVQVENEYAGPGEHLMTLRALARDVGLDVPLYIRTGWPSPATPLPFGQLLPLYGAYAEGFWSRELTDMPGSHWKAFTFETVRTDLEVGMDQLGQRPPGDEIDTPQYPYLTREIGGGMEQSYHRRIFITPNDTLAVVTTKIGSGSNLPGYYMYHGGTNPTGKLSTLNESQATNYWNDVPTLSYDFQAPLGQYGQIREPFAMLRRLHTFIADFGSALAPMRPVLPQAEVKAKTDTTTLRWSARIGPDTGFLFVSNYQRLQPMPPKEKTRLEVVLPNGREIKFPELTIPANSTFIWPMALKLAAGTLEYATAQVVARLSDPTGETLILAATPGVPVILAINTEKGTQVTSRVTAFRSVPGGIIAQNIAPSLDPAVTIRSAAGVTTRFLILDEVTSLRATKLSLAGSDHLVLTPGAAWVEDRKLHIESEGREAVEVSIYPPLGPAKLGDQTLTPTKSGAFSTYTLRPKPERPPTLELTQLSPPAAPRKIALGSQQVAQAPTDADFNAAAVYSIKLPPTLPPNSLARIHYVGDVARAYIDGHLITDQFFNGRVFDILIPPAPPPPKNSPSVSSPCKNPPPSTSTPKSAAPSPQAKPSST